MEHMERMERAERMEPAGCCENGEGGSFVRNNYYPGKLLRAGDFVREQRYGNAKLEFVNRKLHGSGIIEGLEVGTEDGRTLRITAGSAIDYRGRILLAPEDVRVDVNCLDGRDKGEDREFVLGIRYEERQVERERSLLDEKGGSEKGRILETYGLGAYSVEEWERLKDGDDVANLLAEERILYQDALLKLSLRFPMVVPADSIFKVRMEAKVLGFAVREFSRPFPPTPCREFPSALPRICPLKETCPWSTLSDCTRPSCPHRECARQG